MGTSLRSQLKKGGGGGGGGADPTPPRQTLSKSVWHSQGSSSLRSWRLANIRCSEILGGIHISGVLLSLEYNLPLSSY